MSTIPKETQLSTRISIVTPRLDAKPWGGRRLESFGLDLPPGESIGEALITAGDAVVTTGYRSGETLDAIVAADPAAHLGTTGLEAVGGKSNFPLLVKLIDAAENLSIQVHPDDAGARELDRLGKTEAWHVLAAEPGSVLYLGLRQGVDFDSFKAAASRLDGSSAHLLRTMRAQPGTTVMIPAGTIHALGAGVMVYEVQQPSDITYRLDDWGRVDAQGKSRDVHLDAGFTASRPELCPEPIESVSLRPVLGERHLLTACRYFALERVALPVGGTTLVGNEGSPTVVTVLEGSAMIEDTALDVGTSAVIWPTPSPATVRVGRPLVALVATVPNLARDVVAKARQAGTDSRAIAALGGATPDVARELRQ